MKMKFKINFWRWLLKPMLLLLIVLCPVSFVRGNILSKSDKNSISSSFVADSSLSHFWDHYQFSGSTIPVDSFATAFENYLSVLQSVPHKQGLKAFGHFLKLISPNSYFEPATEHIVDSLMFSAHTSSYDDFYIAFLQQKLKRCRLSSSEKERAEFRLKLLQSNLVGHLASDFTFITREGVKGHLRKLPKDADYIVIFFDPDCMQCQMLVSSLRSNIMLNECIRKGRIHVLAVDTEPDLPMWERIKNDLPASWTVACDEGTIQEEGSYDLRSYPAIYLLGKRQKVILKNASLTTLLNHLERYFR